MSSAIGVCPNVDSYEIGIAIHKLDCKKILSNRQKEPKET